MDENLNQGAVDVFAPRQLIRAHLFRRFLAYAVDMLALGVVCVLLSLLFPSLVYFLGQSVLWVGALIFLVYFSLLQTHFTKGQTLGGMLLGVSVFGMDGSHLSLRKSFLRNLIFFILYSEASVIHLIGSLSVAAAISISIIFAFSSFAFFVFILFHPLRRSIHDLASHAILLNRKEYMGLPDADKQRFLHQTVSSKRPIIILGAIGFVMVASGIGLYFLVGNPVTWVQPYFAGFTTIRHDVGHIPGVTMESAIKQTVTFSDGSEAKLLQIVLAAKKSILSDSQKRETIARTIDKRLIETYPNVTLYDGIQIHFIYPYGLGLFSFNATQSHTSSTPEIFKSVYGSTPHWLTYYQPLFVMQFPAPPQVSITAGFRASSEGFDAKYIYATNNSSTTMFIVEAAQFLQSASTSAPQTFLQNSLQQVQKTPGNYLLKWSFIKFKGNPAVSLSYMTSGQHVQSIYFFWSGKPYGLLDRYYSLSEVSVPGQSTSTAFKKFTDSFVARTASTSVPVM